MYEGWTGVILIVLWITTAVTVTIFPVAYLFSGWNSTPEGRAVMMRSTAVMLLVDETVFFYFFPLPNDTWRFWVQAATLVFTIIAATYLAWVLLRTQIQQIRMKPPSVRQQ